MIDLFRLFQGVVSGLARDLDNVQLVKAHLLCARCGADHNHRRPQRALGKQTSAGYAAKCEVSAARKLVGRMETHERGHRL